MKQTRWTKEEDDLLISNYQDHSAIEIANMLNRPLSSVTTKVHRIEIEKRGDAYPATLTMVYNEEVLKVSTAMSKTEVNRVITNWVNDSLPALYRGAEVTFIISKKVY